jgi:serine/threonine protein kinase
VPDPSETADDLPSVVVSESELLAPRPRNLLGCFPGDPEGALSWLPVDDDWAAPLVRGLPREAFATVSEASSPVRSDAASPGRATTTVTRRPDLPAIGSVIDKYRIDSLLGTGGFAAVYRATHLLLRIPVALKLLKPEVVAAKPFLAELLCEEARFTAQLCHPNVVRVFDVTHTPQLTYIVMEYIDGVSLIQMIKEQGALPVSKVLRIGIDVCHGLQAAYEEGMIHRDIKPANILMTAEGTAKIVDLGLAREREAGDRKDKSVVGTPAYMSPEQATQPETVDFRSDIYSLGVTLYHAALGQPPFQGRTPVESISLHQTMPVPSPRDLVPDFPFDLSRLLLWMLEKDPADRPESYEKLLEALEETLQVVALEDLLS